METLESLQLSLDYSQKQVSAAQVEIVRLKKDLARVRELLCKLFESVDRTSVFGRGIYDLVLDEVAKE